MYSKHPSQLRKYTRSPRSPNNEADLEVFDEFDTPNVGKKEDLGYMRFITDKHARLQLQISRNMDQIMEYKNSRIDEMAKPLQLYYTERMQHFDS